MPALCRHHPLWLNSSCAESCEKPLAASRWLDRADISARARQNDEISSGGSSAFVGLVPLGMTSFSDLGVPHSHGILPVLNIPIVPMPIGNDTRSPEFSLAQLILMFGVTLLESNPIKDGSA